VKQWQRMLDDVVYEYKPNGECLTYTYVYVVVSVSFSFFGFLGKFLFLFGSLSRKDFNEEKEKETRNDP
jgi:hypothetical protein